MSPLFAYFELRQLRLITRSLTNDAAKWLVQAFMTCCLDYCNSLFSNITETFSALQFVQSVTGASWCDHITPVLRQLHWLPVRQCIKCSSTSLSMASWCHIWPMTVNWSPTPVVVDCGRLMSCIIPWMNTRLQDKSFVVAGPKLWNTLSA